MDLAVLLTLALALLLFATLGNIRQTNSAWSTAAEELGLSFVPVTLLQPPDLGGEVDGLEVHVSKTKPTGSRDTHTLVEVKLDVDVPASMRIQPLGWLRRLHREVIGTPVAVGDPGFDDVFAVVGHPEDEIVALVGAPGVKHALLEVHAVCASISVENHAVRICEYGHGTRPGEIEGYVRAASHVAQTIAAEVESANGVAIDRASSKIGRVG